MWQEKLYEIWNIMVIFPSGIMFQRTKYFGQQQPLTYSLGPLNEDFNYMWTTNSKVWIIDFFTPVMFFRKQYTNSTVS